MLDVWTKYLDFDSVSRDEYHGGYLAAEYLIGKGHKVIHWFGALHRDANACTRFAGANTAMMLNGLSIPEERCFPIDYENIRRSANELLDQVKRPTAVLALWRSVAIALALAARERGLVLGRDLELVGWCMEEEIPLNYVNHCPELLESSATVVWSICPVIDAALDRLAARRDQTLFQPIRIQLLMRIRLPDRHAKKR
jgi:hypothetical protein